MTMKRIDESTIVRLLREERAKQIRELKTTASVDGDTVDVVSLGLKIKDAAGKLYTVSEILPKSIVAVAAADDRAVEISSEELEKSYEIA